MSVLFIGRILTQAKECRPFYVAHTHIHTHILTHTHTHTKTHTHTHAYLAKLISVYTNTTEDGVKDP